KKNYKINPRIEHYGCLVDLYSRAGRLKDALHVLDEMPIKPNEVVISLLLAVCRDCKDINLAERNIFMIWDRVEIFNYLLLSNIYAATGS
ncbi:pentatricopeptide repeat-containing protein at1g05750 chloroplastic, partial [Phtheirospermum japonicum]